MIDQEVLTKLSHEASAASWPFTALSTIFFFMRTFSRFRMHRNDVGLEDAVFSISWMLNIVRAGVFQKALYATENVDMTNPAATIPAAAFWVIFTDTWVFLSIALPKFGVGILIIRIFIPRRWLHVSILCLCWCLNILAVVGFILIFVQCNPVAGQWDPFKHPETRCWNRSVGLIYACSVSGISAFMDFAFAVYPGIVVWGLQMPTWKKISTTALMGLGLCSCAFAIVKLSSNTYLFGYPSIYELLYHGIRIGMWNSIENDFVLSAACLPSVPQFFRACGLFGKLGSATTSFSRGTQLSSFTKLKPSSRSDIPDDNIDIEVAPATEPSRTYEDRRRAGFAK